MPGAVMFSEESRAAAGGFIKPKITIAPTTGNTTTICMA
jgi:hypothetical protein